MEYIILDLEWNNAFSKKLNRYACEIFEIGAVKLNEKAEKIGEFSQIIKPQVLSEFNSTILELTKIDLSELENAKSLVEVLEAFEAFADGEDTVIMTWSKSDLHVLLENYRYIYPSLNKIPFMKKYVDLQAYVQSKLNVEGNNQIGLINAAEMLGVKSDDLPLHRAINDSIISSRCLAKTLDENRLKGFIFEANEKYFKRIFFKTRYISSLKDKRINRKDMKFFCTDCNKPLKLLNKWRYKNRNFYAYMICPKCKSKYKCTLKVKETGEGIQKSRKIIKFNDDSQSKGEKID